MDQRRRRLQVLEEAFCYCYYCLGFSLKIRTSSILERLTSLQYLVSFKQMVEFTKLKCCSQIIVIGLHSKIFGFGQELASNCFLEVEYLATSLSDHL